MWGLISYRLHLEMNRKKIKASGQCVCSLKPFASRAFAQSIPPAPPGSVWLDVCSPTWLVQGLSVPVEAAMAADNANWLPVIITNCPTARNCADTLGGVCLRSVCASVCALELFQSYLHFWTGHCMLPWPKDIVDVLRQHHRCMDWKTVLWDSLGI